MPERALVVDDEIGMRTALEASLRRAGWQVECAAGTSDAMRKFETTRHALVITDMRMPDGDGLQVIRRVRDVAPTTPIILLTAYGSVPEAVQAVKAGACDYLIKPVTTEHLHQAIARLMRRGEQAATPLIVGNSPRLLSALQSARMAARTNADVLIEAESGTGKELLARYIHEQSRCHAGPFVAVNCAAVPDTLLESELFGHVRGAFTGAVTTKKGKFELAHGGSLLLDEIGEMPLSLQPKLLRVLQERRIERIGDSQTTPVDVRVIATTNRNLAELVQDHSFRADLYFRLNVIPLTLPPLRERLEDVPELALHFARTSLDVNREAELTPEFLARLLQYQWPGNVRELANTIRRALVFASGRSIGPDALMFSAASVTAKRPPAPESRRDMDRQLFECTLARMNGNRTRTAEALGVSVRTVRNKIRDYELGTRLQA